MSVNKLALSLFWRTFFLLAMLLAGGVFAWVQTFRALEAEPRATQSAKALASLVNLTRSALLQTDGINRIAMVKSMSGEDAVKITPRERNDQWQPYEVDSFTKSIADSLRAQLGPGTVVAQSVNDKPGLWVGFTIGNDAFWLYTDRTRVQPVTLELWGPWVAIALIATILGSVAIARFINKPLRELSEAASRIRDGEYDSRLDETTRTSEIREVNMGFNRMARELAKVDEDRSVMLAGISHDLRTPLARLRLEAEMSVEDEEARNNMAQDIDQLDAIIDKFLDYARPGDVTLEQVPLALLVERETNAFRKSAQIRIQAHVPADIKVLADGTELGRVLQNLFENARRYGRSADSGVAEVELSVEYDQHWVRIKVRDHGVGVPPEKLKHLTTPFFRGDAARTAATGAGLGLAIVEKALQRMGGSMELRNARDGGLQTIVQLKRAA
jgi:two-component system osmolarity sensor histidine kinase EnvZ